MRKIIVIPQIPKRFYSLDVVRGIAAFGVVLWHWQHFYYIGTVNYLSAVKSQPFYQILFLFYEHGAYGVYLFFSLSGFIFYWLYSEPINKKKITGKEFFILRFSRLYPLHFLTLMFVLLVQVYSKHLTGSYSVYAINDLWHFVLNILFISHWGFQQGPSFNAPVWSVSVEVLLYILFFIFASRNIHSLLFVAAVIFGSYFVSSMPPEILNGIFCFYAGGAVYLLYKQLIKKYDLKILLSIFIPITLMLWSVSITEVKLRTIQYHLGNMSELIFSHKFVYSIYGNFAFIFLFPITILTLVLFETYRGRFGKRLKIIGDISYSVYLWHFPLQLTFILAMPFLNITHDFFYLKRSLLIFYIMLIAISYISFNYFERPAQKLIRERLIK